jgi:hypothetical protein
MDMRKMQKIKVNQKSLQPAKISALAICFVILLSLAVTPLNAQLNAARNLSGTWQSSSSGMYYEMDAFGTGIRQADVTGTFAMDITQNGNQITIALYLNPISWVADPAFLQEYGGITGAPPVAGEIDFTGTVSSSGFTASETGSQLTSEQLTGTFTTNIITATLSGTAETTDQNGIVVTLTSSSTSAPTQAPTSPSTTTQPLASRYYGNIASVNGQAWTNDANGNTPLSTGQIVSGTEILTGSSGIVAFEPPNQGGTVYIGPNSDGGWVGLTSEPAPDNGIQYIIYPPVSRGTIFPNGAEQLTEMKYTIPLDIALAVLVFSHPLGEAAAVALFVEGGAFLIPNGVAYVKETVSHFLAVPQGGLAGDNTEYTVNVSSNGTTLVQVINGPVIFMDPVTNNTVTVETNQALTLPALQQSGFTESQLQSYVSALDPASVNRWWTQGSTDAFSLNGFMSQSAIIMILAVIIVIVIAALAASITRNRRVIRQRHASESSTSAPNPESASLNILPFKKRSTPAPQQTTEQPKLLFCPDCGQKLPLSKKFCPYCGHDLSMQGKQNED